MATELNTLYLTLRYYKESVLRHLEKVDLQIQDAVRNFPESDHANPSSVKFKITMLLCDVLQNYITMLHTFEVLSEKVTEKLSRRELEAEPERARPNCNPFFGSPTRANSSDLALILRAIKKECARSLFTENGTSLDQCSNVQEGTALSEERLEQPSSRDQSDSLPDNSSEASSDTIRNAVEMKTEPEEPDQSQKVSELTELLTNSALIEFSSDDDTDVEDTKRFLTAELNPFPVKPPFLDPSSSDDNSNTCVDDGTTVLINSSELNSSVKIEETVVDKSQTTREHLAPLLNLDVEEVEPPGCEEDENECRRQVAHQRVHQVSNESGTRNSDVNVQRGNENGIKNSKQVFKFGAPNRKIFKKSPRCNIYDIAAENLCVGQICNVCHVVSPGEFYVRKDQPSFETMEGRFTDDMNRQHLYVVNNFKSKSEAKLHLGSYCCGFVYNRHKWYRVEVLDWMERDSGSDILVQLIDYGEKATWSYNQLKPISDGYAQIPKNAIRCHLAGVLSPDPKDRRAWPASSVEFFTEASDIVKKTPFLTIFVSNAGDSYAVDLQKADEAEGRSLGKLLIMHGHASEVTFSDQKVSEPTSPALPQLELPPRGKYFEVLITSYISACRFYVHILKERKECEVFNDEFVDLLAAMKAPSLTDTYEPISDVPNIGELLLVKDGPHWYRGRCLRVCKDQRIEIFLEDFGRRIKKRPTSVRKMKDELLKVPFQAVECVLHNCKEKKMKDGDVSSENFFNCVMKMKLFKAYLVDAGKPIKLHLWDSKSHDLGVVLQQYGLCD